MSCARVACRYHASCVWILGHNKSVVRAPTSILSPSPRDLRLFTSEHHLRQTTVVHTRPYTYSPHPRYTSIVWALTTKMVANKSIPPSLTRTTASAPKLPPLPKLRVRRPDATNANPCLGVMSSVLGMSCLKVPLIRYLGTLTRKLGTGTDSQRLSRLLGIQRASNGGLRGAGAESEVVHGCAQTQPGGQESD